MMQNIKISSYQFLVLVTFFSMGTSILIIPSVLAEGAKQDAWIAAIVGTIIGLIVIWLFCFIAQWFPNLTFIQINEKILGKWIGKAVSLLFVFMSFIYAASLLFYSGTFLNIHLMPNTPMTALNILLALVIVIGVRLGLETIARSAEIFIFFFFALFILLFLFILPEIKLENIQPIFEVGPRPILQSSLSLIEVTSVTTVVLLMIFPACINNIKQAKKSFYIGYLVGGFVIIILTFLSIAVLGAYSTAAEYHPSYELAKRINIGNFIQRIEALMAGIWILALFFKTILYFYAAVFGMAQIFNLKDYKPLTIPLGTIVVVLSLVIYPNVIYQEKWNATIGIFYSFAIGIVLPLLLIVVNALRKTHLKKGKSE
ncbi:spore gernimation protein [Solibacillus sp. R5-41]|uniref:GerAB/ArcD/ProY family transporter n=1 Tax=Solibacillus sp. R5-41 TaxID=2048654 RepID=UPI000C12613B|nr:endospore germination permease [Solibacillus sp. R5-41]ATP39661.1 spore gernimation protein [Solibacillus sp. R5-41]